MNKLYLTGCGPGSEELLTGRAEAVIMGASRVLSTGRLSRAAGNGNVKTCTLTELAKELKSPTEGDTAVLVSGDCCFFSVAKSIAKEFSGLYDVRLINGISSVQYLSAKTAVPYDGAVLCSMHGRDGRLIPKVCYNKRVFALTGGENKAQDICAALAARGLSGVRVTVGERLSYPDERIATGTAGELAGETFGDLSVMYIENGSWVNPHTPLSDGDFIRGEAPMTKEEVRWLSLQKLGIQPADTVFDIGAGTGSVSVEAARKAFEGCAFAIEMKAEAAELIERNRAKHGAYNLTVLRGKAPEALAALPKPDKAFIGGSGGDMREILEALITKNPAVKLTANAVTLQSLSRIIEGYKSVGITEPDIVCVNVARAKKVGSYDMMTAQNPVYIITGQRRSAAGEENG